MAKRKIYLSQLESAQQQKRLMEEYHVGFETYEFSMSASLNHLQNGIQHFTETFPWDFSDGLSFHGPFLDLNTASFDDKILEVTRERYESCYQAAKNLGADRVVYHSCFYPQIYWAQCWAERSILFWKDFLKDKDDRIKIHMENLYDPDFSYLCQVVDAVDHPAFSLCVDVAHANVFSKIPVMQWLEGLRGKIGHFHLSNNDGLCDQHKGLYCGTLDMDAVTREINHCYPHVSCTLEISDVKDAEESLKLLPKLLKI